MSKEKKKRKIRKKIKKKILKTGLKKKKSSVTSKQINQPKEQKLFQPLIKAYENFVKQRKFESFKQIKLQGKEREIEIKYRTLGENHTSIAVT